MLRSLHETRRGRRAFTRLTRARQFFLVFGGVALYAGGMWIGAAILALLVVVAMPALIEAGTPTLRGLGWLVVVVGATVLLIDLADRLTEWVERRRWGRRR